MKKYTDEYGNTRTRYSDIPGDDDRFDKYDERGRTCNDAGRYPGEDDYDFMDRTGQYPEYTSDRSSWNGSGFAPNKNFSNPLGGMGGGNSSNSSGNTSRSSQGGGNPQAMSPDDLLHLAGGAVDLVVDFAKSIWKTFR